MSNYETKPGNGAIFKNKKKQEDKHPDYVGDIVTPSGEALRLSLWVKTGQQSGEKYFSVSVQPPYQSTQATPVPATPEQANTAHADDLPF